MTKIPCVFAHNHYLCIVKRKKTLSKDKKRLLRINWF